MKSRFRYQANICGGDFQHVRDCFVEWKRQPLVYRQSQPMFEGKEEVRPLSDSAFGNGEVAHTVLTQVCNPRDPMHWQLKSATANATCGLSWLPTTNEIPGSG